MVVSRRFKKSAIGATSVTLVPSTAADAEQHPGQILTSQIVVTTGAGTPVPEFWGTTTTDGVEYIVTITRVS